MEMDIETIVSRDNSDEGDDLGRCEADDLGGDDLGWPEGDDLGGNAADDSITPKAGMEFPTQVDAYKFYNRYALKMRFGIKWSSTTKSRTDKSLVIGRTFVCNKEGKKKEGIVNQDVHHTRESYWVDKCYTRALFTMFKQEMKDGKSYWVDKVQKEGTLTTYAVGRPQTERSKWRRVSYDSDGAVVSCDCRYFESVGLLCRHALCILWKKQVSQIPDRYIMKRWTIDSRYRHVDADLGNNVGASEGDQDLLWGIRYKFKKVLEEAYKSPAFAVEIDRLLTKKVAEIVNLSEGVDVSSRGLNSQVDPIAPLLSQNSSNLFPEINIRDPTAAAKTKGRPKLPTRIQSLIEESQEEDAKKKRTCGFCGKKGHYRTGCSKAKELLMDGGDAF